MAVSNTAELLEVVAALQSLRNHTPPASGRTPHKGIPVCSQISIRCQFQYQNLVSILRR